MDLREKKTKRSIKNAFIQLRSEKPLEKISVKELAELAEISKATFYLHYHDIYDLSEQLQWEVLQNVLNSLPNPEICLTDSALFTDQLFHAFHAHQALIDILFSGSQSSVLPVNIEKGLKDYIFSLLPESKDDPKLNILLTYEIMGGFYTYQMYHNKYGIDTIMDVLKGVLDRSYEKEHSGILDIEL